MKIRLFIIITLFAACITAITAFELKTANYKDPDYFKSELYFGLSIPGGGNVSAAEWQSFADTVIAVSLTDGFTLIDAKGQWFENGRPEREDSKILVVLFPKSDTRISEELELIRAKYIKCFHQQSVLRVDEDVRVSF